MWLLLEEGDDEGPEYADDIHLRIPSEQPILATRMTRSGPDRSRTSAANA